MVRWQVEAKEGGRTARGNVPTLTRGNPTISMASILCCLPLPPLLLRYTRPNQSFLPPYRTLHQWNEQLLRGMNSLYTTDWGKLASRAYTQAKTEAQTLTKRLSS